MQRVRRIVTMLGTALLALALVVPAIAATPGSREVRIQVTFTENPADETFVASGPGICTSGTVVDHDWWFLDFDESFGVRMTKRLVCDDGSGTIVFLLSAGHAGVGQTSGGWAIIDGTGDYAKAVGGGTLTATSRQRNDSAGVDTMTGVIQP